MASSPDIALKVSGVSKNFKLPKHRMSSLKERVLNFSGQKYETFHALSNINFEVRKGEFFGIVGRNGSGKSTMLKIIAGIYQPTKGTVEVNGSLTPFIELGIGFNPELTGRENVYLNGAILGLTRKEVQSKYDEIVAFAELEKFMDQKLKNYSSGMQVRLAFSIAIQAHNNILLIDEVLAVGDAAFQAKCLNVFQDIKARGDKTVVFVTHDMESVRRFCDRAIMIDNSKIVAEGSPMKVSDAYLRANTASVGQELPFGVESIDADKSVAKIVGFKLNTDKASPGSTVPRVKDKFSVDIKVKFNRDCVEPVPGFSMRNSAGQLVVSTNSRWINVKTGSYKKGQTATFRFSLKNNLERGLYLMSANVVGDDMKTFYDWRNDFAEVFIEQPQPTGGIARLDYNVETI